MEKFVKIIGKSGYNIDAKIFFQNDKKFEQIIIACHGFGGDKESSAINMLAEKAIEKNIALICFDFPGHGKSEVDGTKLTIENCINDLESVEEYVRSIYGNIKVGIFGTSFGAYIPLLKMSKTNCENKYNFIILRAPAVCMDEIYVNALLQERLESYKDRGYTKLGFDRDMNVSYEFYNELKENNLFKLYNSKKEMLIIQGTEDDIAPIKDTIKFIKEKNSNIILHKIIGADHRMKKPGELEEAVSVSMKYIQKFS